MNLLELSEQEIIRRNSMEQLRQMGIEPYPAAEYVTNAFSKEIKETFKDDAEPRPVSIAGRIMSRRIMGYAFIPILLASFKVVILQNIRDGSRMQDDNALCNSNVKLEGDEV